MFVDQSIYQKDQHDQPDDRLRFVIFPPLPSSSSFMSVRPEMPQDVDMLGWTLEGSLTGRKVPYHGAGKKLVLCWGEMWLTKSGAVVEKLTKSGAAGAVTKSGAVAVLVLWLC